MGKCLSEIMNFKRSFHGLILGTIPEIVGGGGGGGTKKKKTKKKQQKKNIFTVPWF
jgi:hypothetical protein